MDVAGFDYTSDAFDAALAAAIEDGIEPPRSRFVEALYEALCAVARSHPDVDVDLVKAALNAWLAARQVSEEATSRSASA